MCGDSSIETNKTHSHSHSHSHSHIETNSHSQKPSLHHYSQYAGMQTQTFLPIYQKNKKNQHKNTKYLNILKKMFSQFCSFSDMLFDQKSPVHAVLGPWRWHTQTGPHTDGRRNLQTESAQVMIQCKSLFLVIGCLTREPHLFDIALG